MMTMFGVELLADYRDRQTTEWGLTSLHNSLVPAKAPCVFLSYPDHRRARFESEHSQTAPSSARRGAITRLDAGG
jgi:hypothetical protein